MITRKKYIAKLINHGVIILTVLFFNLKTVAQNHIINRDWVTLTGEISGIDTSRFLKNPEVSIYEGGSMDGYFPVPTGVQNIPIIIVDGKFSLTVPLKSKYGYLRFAIMKKMSFLNFGFPLISRGDSLHLEINKTGFKISGSKPDLLKFELNCYNKMGYLLGLKSWTATALPTMFRRCDSIIYANKFFAHGNPELTTLVNTEYRARFKSVLLSALKQMTSTEDDAFRSKAYELLTNEDLGFGDYPNHLLVNNTLQYIKCIYLFNELKISYGQTDRTMLFDELYHTFRNSYKFPLQDRLTAYLFWFNFKKGGNAQTLIADALNSTKDSLSKAMLMSVYESKAAGKKAFNFQLPDTNGNIRTLSEFLGKTLVFHFWFTNCGGCIDLSKNLASIIDKYKNDPKIVFINVCVDKNIALWKKSIKSGIYSHTGEVLLYTSGFGADHPLLKYYKFISFPSMLIVDRSGNLVTANPIRPVDETSRIEFERLIN